MKVFLTGATGFIGGQLAPRLLRDGHELRCLVRRPESARRLEALGATTVTGDVTDRASIERALAGCDCVAHLANVYSFWERDRSVYARVNVEGTRHVMECALAARIPRVSRAGARRRRGPGRAAAGGTARGTLATHDCEQARCLGAKVDRAPAIAPALARQEQCHDVLL